MSHLCCVGAVTGAFVQLSVRVLLSCRSTKCVCVCVARPFSLSGFLSLLIFCRFPPLLSPSSSSDRILQPTPRVLASIDGLRMITWRRVPVESECLGKTDTCLQLSCFPVVLHDEAEIAEVINHRLQLD